MKLFALASDRDLGGRVADALGARLAAHEEREFPDGEHKARPLEGVRGEDVYVLASLYEEPARSVDGKLVRLLFFLGALRDAAAERVTAVVPYLCYARKDRKSQPRDPVTTRYVAALFEAVGVDRVVTLDVHNLQAFQNGFRCATEHLEARSLLVARAAPRLAGRPAVVVSPDAGGVKRARRFRDALAGALDAPVPTAFMEKERSGGVVSGELLVGDVEGRVALIVDDMIGTGTTLARAAAACRRQGAAQVLAVATHGLFVGDARQVLAEPSLEGLLVTDTVPPFRVPAGPVRAKLEVVPAGGLLAQAIERLHRGGSLVELVEGS